MEPQDRILELCTKYAQEVDGDAELELSVSERRRQEPDWAKLWQSLVVKNKPLSFQTDTRSYNDHAISNPGLRQTRYTVRKWVDGKKVDPLTGLLKTTSQILDIGGVRAKYSIEKVVEPQTRDMNMMRIRLRMSSVPDWAPDWRLDFTRLEVIPLTQTQKIAETCNNMFAPGLNIEEFLRRANLPSGLPDSDRLGLELEYVGESAITPELLKKAIDDFRNFLRGAGEETEYNKMVRYLGGLLGRHMYPNPTLKQIGVNVLPLDRLTYAEILEAGTWAVSEKADGEHAWVAVLPDSGVYLVSHQLTKTSWKMPKAPKITILDGEWIEKLGQFYVFDSPYMGEDITKLPLNERLERVKDVVEELGLEMKQHRYLTTGEPVLKTKVLKSKEKTTGPSDVIDQVKNKKYPYALDGLVFTNVSDSYWTKPRKWKSPGQTTIDFFVLKAPASALRDPNYPPKKDHTLMFLFNGIRNDDNRQELTAIGVVPFPYYDDTVKGIIFGKRFPMQFSPMENKMAYMYYHPNSVLNPELLHRKVAEFRYKDGWEFERLRPDRDIEVQTGAGFGNAYAVAISTFQNLAVPFTYQELLKPKKKTELSYFRVEKDPKWRKVTHYNNFVKSRLISQLVDVIWVADLCCGKGQELLKYTATRIPHIVMVDQDQMALNEIQTRVGWIYDPAQNKFGMRPPPKSYKADIHTKRADMSRPASVDKHLRDLNPAGYQAIVANFCLHYLIKDHKSADELIEMVAGLLNKRGRFIFTLFKGEVVHKLLQAHNYDWNLEIYHIVGKAGKLDFGAEIKVAHPFSGEELVPEYLVPIYKLMPILQKHGLVLIQSGSFGDWYNDYKTLKEAKELSEADRIYSSLYYYYSFMKV